LKKFTGAIDYASLVKERYNKYTKDFNIGNFVKPYFLLIMILIK